MKIRQGMAVVALIATGACSSNTVKDTLGLYRSAPDEYRVVSRPPLSVPPQFGLKAPSSSTTSPGDVSAPDQAQAVVLGNGSVAADTAVKPVKATAAKKKSKDSAVSGADSQFLKKIGADEADPKVREELVEESYQRIEKKETAGWMDKLDWTSDKKDPLVDAKKEADRIQQNEDAGKPVTEGATPEVKGRDTGLLGKILDY